MNTVNKTSRVLGLAFLLQLITSLFSGTILRQAWLVAGNIRASMLIIANKPWLMQATILVDMLTALGILFMGGILFMTLRKQNDKKALMTLGFYILEAALLAVNGHAALAGGRPYAYLYERRFHQEWTKV